MIKWRFSTAPSPWAQKDRRISGFVGELLSLNSDLNLSYSLVPFKGLYINFVRRQAPREPRLDVYAALNLNAFNWAKLGSRSDLNPCRRVVS